MAATENKSFLQKEVVVAVSRCRCLVISVVSLGEVKLLQQANPISLNRGCALSSVWAEKDKF